MDTSESGEEQTSKSAGRAAVRTITISGALSAGGKVFSCVVEVLSLIHI